MKQRLSLVIACAGVMLVSACGGGSSGSFSPGQQSTPGPDPGATAIPNPQFIPKSVTITTSGLPILGQPASFPLNVVATNLFGQQITGQFSSPITLTLSDATGTVTVSPLTISNGSTPVTLNYTGGSLSGPVTIGAKWSGTGSLQVTPLAFTPNADNPVTTGTSAQYTSTSTSWQTFPTQTATTTTTQSYVDTMIGNATFNNVTNLVGEHVTFNVPSGTQTQDTYVQLASTSSGITLHEVGLVDSTTGSSGTTIDTIAYPAPFRTMDMIPHAAGHTWSGLAEEHEQILNPSGTSTKGSWNADGSGTSSTISSAITSTYTLNSNGSITGTIINSGVTTTYSYSVPTTIAGQLYLVYTSQGGSGPVVINVPDWYPNPGGSATPMRSDTVTDNGSVGIPAQCNLLPAIATVAEDLHDDRASLFVQDGTDTVVTDDQYIAPGIGLVCEITQTQQTLYDYAATGQETSAGTSVVVTTLAGGGFGPLARKGMNAHAAASGVLPGRGVSEFIERTSSERLRTMLLHHTRE